jgi:hypothetical protein
VQQLIILRHTARFRFVKNAAVHKALVLNVSTEHLKQGLNTGVFQEPSSTK